MSFIWNPRGITALDVLVKADECAIVAAALEQAGEHELAAKARREESLWRAVARGTASGEEAYRRSIEAGEAP